ncbi:MAG: 4-demethylwyosine synthase TYW1 [Candidatus Methanomethyliaceae archaeon]|nr:4-demethylwyosine synthase TYW1 [Candidatus Methanomethyliaceae archaeon]
MGRHSAVKTCLWVKNSLTKGKVCYKEKFYGIKSHRCLQMSPAVAYCSNRCLYCWRLMPGERGLNWDGEHMPEEDDPKEIVEGALKVHRKALNGFKGNPLVPRQRWEEAVRPRHVAISLSGEPTNYSRLDGLIEEFGKREMTTFLVTNGTNPGALKRIRDPTQLYISLSAPSEEAYRRVCRPTIDGNWGKVMESLALLSGFSCPTVVRITAVRDLNMFNPDAYSRVIMKSNPTYVEVKAYMHVGFSTSRLGYDSMPSHSEILGFAKELAERTGYDIVDEVPISRVVLLSRIGKPKNIS